MKNNTNLAKQKASEYIDKVIKISDNAGCKAETSQIPKAKAEATKAFMRLQRFTPNI